MNPDHLFDQADRLIQPSAGLGAPRQADLRRAISSAYYALFHYVLKAGADMSVGAAMRKTNPDLYGRAYRSLEHADVLNRSKEARTIGSNIKAFADAIVDPQQTRLSADYEFFASHDQTPLQRCVQRALRLLRLRPRQMESGKPI
jgi:hypothetical protein